MILLFDPRPPYLEWCWWEPGRRTVHSVGLTGEWLDRLAGELPEPASVEAMGFILREGGDLFQRSSEPVTADTITRARRVTHLARERDRITLALLERWAPADFCPVLVVLCETAFFSGLPPEVRDYALPPEIAERGIHRRGGHGLCHEQSWNQATELSDGAASKIISVFVGDHSDVAAIRDGRAVESTIGLTELEGVMSAGGCGDIDPTIIFQLGASGMPYSSINRMLSAESGFTGLMGRPCGLAGILSDDASPQSVLARRIYVYQLTKYVGAFMAALGGADTVVFTGEQPLLTGRVALEVCNALSPLGVRYRMDAEPGSFPRLVSTPDSSLRVLLAQYDVWETMGGRISVLIEESKESR